MAQVREREREPARVKALSALAAPWLARVARSPLAALSAVACVLVAALLAQSLAGGALIPLRVAVPRAAVTSRDPAALAHVQPGEIPPWTISLTSITMASPTDGWASGFTDYRSTNGATPILLHYDGSAWRRVDGLALFVSALVALPTGDVWGTTSLNILHYSGATWNVEAGDIAGPSVGFSSISMLSAEEGWAVGSESNNAPAGPTGSDTVPVYTRPLLLHYQQGTWTRLPADPQLDNVQLSSISMRSPDDGWAVGNAIGGSIAPVVLRYSGGQWRRLASAFPGGSLLSISAAGPGEAWAVGYGGPVSGIALHCVRDACTRVEMPTSNILSAVAMRSPTDGWIGGHGAVTLHYDGHQWTKAGLVIHGEVLTGLAMQSATEGWAAGDPFSADYGMPLLRCHNGVWQPEELHIRLP